MPSLQVRPSRLPSLLATSRKLGLLALLVLALPGGRVAGQDDNADSMFELNRKAIQDNKLERTKAAGFPFVHKAFSETTRSNGYLMGFEFGLGKFANNREVIYTVTPIYRGPFGDGRGQTYGETQNKTVGKTVIKTQVTRTQRIEARNGYAVSGLTLYSTVVINGMQVHFTRINGARLNNADTYSAEWVGTQDAGGARAQTIGAGENPVLGIFGSLSNDGRECQSVGLIYRDAKAVAAVPQPPPPEPKPIERPKATRPAPKPVEREPVVVEKPAPVPPPAVVPPPTLPSPWPTPTAPAVVAEPAGTNWGLVVGIFALVAMAAFGVFYAVSQKEAPARPQRRPTGERRPDRVPPPESEAPADAGHLAAGGLDGGHLSGAIMEPDALPSETRPGPRPESPLPSLRRARDVDLRLRAGERVGFGPRLGAALIDVGVALCVALILGLVAALIGGAVMSAATGGESQRATTPGMPSFGLIFGIATIGAVMILAIWPLMLVLAVWEALSGAALGKRTLGLRVCAADGTPAPIVQLLQRAGVKFGAVLLALFGAMLPGILGSGVGLVALLAMLVILGGFFLTLNDQRQALHDLAAQTAVFRERKAPTGPIEDDYPEVESTSAPLDEGGAALR